jgi:NADPH2:quinone reductase
MITVRAARLHEHGKPLVIESVDLPEPSEDEVLVELEFGGVNPIDTYDGRPVMVVSEGLGTGRDGVWAAAAVVPRAAVHELPDGVSARDAAAMGVAGHTAWNVVHELGRVSAEDRVLVLGASGGVGTMIVSLASAAGAIVWGQTGSAAKTEVIERQGAARAIVAGAGELADALDGFVPTVVCDALGDGFAQPVIEALAPGGKLVSFGASAGPEVTLNIRQLYRKGLSLLGYGDRLVTREQRREGMKAVLDALRNGEMKVVIDDVLPLEDAGEAFARLARRGVCGKLLLKLDG